MTTPTEREAQPWPFVETPGDFTLRLKKAIDYFGLGNLLGAVRHVLIENPATLLEADAQEITRLNAGWHEANGRVLELQLELDGIRKQEVSAWLWVAQQGGGAYQARMDEPMRGYAYKAPLYLAAGAQQVAVPQETSHGIAHSLGGFRGGFHCQFGRMPTEQEIWNHAIRSWRDLHPAAPQPPQAERVPMTEAEIRAWWESENGLEDCDMCNLADFEKVIHAVEARYGIRSKP